MNVSGTSLYFYFNQQGGGVPKTVKKMIFFDFFFVDCSIADAKLVFAPRYSVLSDALIETGVHL